MKISTGMDVHTKAELVRKMVEESIGIVSGDELLTITCHLDHFYLNRRKEPLTEKEMLVYTLLNKEQLNPCTVYSWLLASRAPADAKKRHELGRINVVQLARFGRNEVEREKAKTGLEFIREIKDLVEVVLK